MATPETTIIERAVEGVVLISKIVEVPAVVVLVVAINTWVREEEATITTIRETRQKEIITIYMEIIHKKVIIVVVVKLRGMDKTVNNNR